MHPIQQRIHIAGSIFVTLSRSEDGVWTAETEIPTHGGPIKLTAQADERVIRKNVARLTRNQLFRLVHKAIHALPASARDDSEEVVASGIFDDIGDFFTKTIPKAVNTVAKSKVFKDIAKGISEVAKNPIVQGAMSIIPGGGLLNQGMQQAGHAASLLAKAKSGDQLAKQGIQAIADAAASGSPKAKQSMDLLKSMNANPLQYMPGGAPQTVSGAAFDFSQGRHFSQLPPDVQARGASLLARAFGGDPNAQQGVQRIAQKADMGDPRAREVASMLANMAAAGQARPAPPGFMPQMYSSGDAGTSKCGSQQFASGGDTWPKPGPVDSAQYQAMVEKFHSGGVFPTFGRRRPPVRSAHPLRGHSMHYGLPFRLY